MAKKSLEAERVRIVNLVSAFLGGNIDPLIDFEVLTTGSNEICVPIVGSDGEEGYVVLTFKIPKGSRDGEPYDGYEVAKDYAFHLEEKARKDKERAEAKAKKIERDKKMREEKRKVKEKAE